MSILWNFDIKVLLEYDGFLSQIFVVVMNLVLTKLFSSKF